MLTRIVDKTIKYTLKKLLLLNKKNYFKWKHQSFDMYCTTSLYQPVVAVGGTVQNDKKS